LVLFMLLASCNSGGDGGFLSRAPEESTQPEGGPFCGPHGEVGRARLDLIRRATSNLEVESTIERIRELHQELLAEAPAEVSQQVQLTVAVYNDYLDVLEEQGYGKAPMEDITSDEYNAAELAQQSYCFQNPGR
jgi:hypothetical protein